MRIAAPAIMVRTLRIALPRMCTDSHVSHVAEGVQGINQQFCFNAGAFLSYCHSLYILNRDSKCSPKRIHAGSMFSRS